MNIERIFNNLVIGDRWVDNTNGVEIGRNHTYYYMIVNNYGTSIKIERKKAYVVINHLLSHYEDSGVEIDLDKFEYIGRYVTSESDCDDCLGYLAATVERPTLELKNMRMWGLNVGFRTRRLTEVLKLKT